MNKINIKHRWENLLWKLNRNKKNTNDSDFAAKK